MSVSDGLEKVKLGYGEFAIVNIAQDAGGNIVTVAAADMPIAGDYFYSVGNGNGASAFTEVLEVLSSTTFRIDLTSGAGVLEDGTFSLCKEFDTYHSDNENMMIVGKPKTTISKSIIENIIGKRTILDIDLQPLTEAERLFMYQFVKSDQQRAEVFGIIYSDVVLMEQDALLELIEGLFFATGLKFSLVDRSVTARSVGSYTAGTTNSSGYKSSSADGTRVKLTMNWGAGDISRNFTVNLADCYSVSVDRLEFEFLDEQYGRVNNGFRTMFNIDFGTFGYNDTAETLQADLDWIKTFVLAPSKTIEVYNIYKAEVVNAFDTLTVGYIGGFVMAKTLALQFIGRSLQQNQIPESNTFTLDSDTLGILDSNTPLG